MCGRVSTVPMTLLPVYVCGKRSDMISALVLGALILNAFGDAAPNRMERMTVSKMRMADLESSASGYTYSQQQGLPVSYVQYTNHGSGRYYRAPDTVHYVLDPGAAPVAPAVSETQRYQPAVLAYATAEHEIVPPAVEQSYTNGEIANYPVEQLPKYVPPLASVKPEPRALYYPDEKLDQEEKIVGAAGPEGDDESGAEEDVDEEDAEDEEDGDYEGGEENGNEDDGGSENESGADSSSFEAGGGDEFAVSKDSAHGKKGRKGYKTQREFDKGEHEKHDNSGQEGYYSVESGRKKGHSDKAGSYGEAEDAEKVEKGGSYGQSSYHKKGHKTTGFHNIYRKDEYKKDTDFYDNDHKEGGFEKHGAFDEHHKEEKGGFEKGGHHDSGFDEAHKGKKGYYDKGHRDVFDEGHKSEKGGESYYNDQADYENEKGASSGRKYGFSKGHH